MSFQSPYFTDLIHQNEEEVWFVRRVGVAEKERGGGDEREDSFQETILSCVVG